jgi:hypothetical protein
VKRSLLREGGRWTNLLKLWEDKNRANAQALIHALLKVRTKDGWPVDEKYLFGVSELAYSSVNPELIVHLALSVLSTMHARLENSIDKFEARTAQEANVRQSKVANAQRKWRFFTPIDIEVDTKVRRPVRVSVSGRAWFFITYKSLERFIGKTTLRRASLDIFHNRKVDMNYGTFLSGICEASTWKEAWLSLEPSFDLLRGWIEFTLGFGGYRILSSDQGARRMVPHPPWVIGKTEHGKATGVSFILEEQPPRRKPFRFDQKVFDILAKNAKSLPNSTDEKSIDALLESVIRLYGQAVEAQLNYSCLLGLWQIAETIAQPVNPTGDTSRIATRLAALGEGQGWWASAWRYSLGHLAKQRNAIVHRGMRNISDRDVALLKIVVDHAISWLYGVRRDLPTRQHLEYYYSNATLSATNLAALSAAVKGIQSR